MAIIGLTACSGPHPISETEFRTSLTAAVQFAAKSRKISAEACVSMPLADSRMILGGRMGEWIKAADGKASFRRLQAPRAERLTPDVIAALPTKMQAIDCRHKLVFQRPEFVELKEGGRVSILALVNFSDTCPTCGAGYSMTLTKSGEHWEPSQPELDITWMS